MTLLANHARGILSGAMPLTIYSLLLLTLLCIDARVHIFGPTVPPNFVRKESRKGKQ